METDNKLDVLLANQNILFFSRAIQHAGTENVIVQLIKILKPYAGSIVLCCSDGFRTDILKEMGIRFYKIPDIESKSPIVMARVIKTLRKIIKDEKITIIHTHHRMAAFYIRIMHLDRKCCFINTSHNTFYNKKILTRYSYKNCHLISCGEMVKKNLEDIFRLNNVTVIHNAVMPFDGNIIEDQLLRKLHNSGYILVGNIGRLSEQKGFEYFIESIPIVLEKCQEARFLIVGNGEDEEKLKRLVENKKLSNYVYFMGYREDIQNLMKQMDFIVLSSLWEGLPLTPIEAFSVGKTVVATAVDGTVEIIEDGKNGFLVEPRNPVQLAKKIIYLIRHNEKHIEMENAALKRYEDEFSFNIFADRYLIFYRNVIKYMGK